MVGLLIGVTANAEHKEQIFFPSQAPIICAKYQQLEDWLKHNNFEPVNVGLGRDGGKSDGTPVFLIMGYLKKGTDVYVATIETPTRVDKCLMFNVYDFKEVDREGNLN
jgi:hypothetical protein